jgi:hypothetical protein
LRLYDELAALEATAVTDSNKKEIADAKTYLENVSNQGCEISGFTYAPLSELKLLQ